jgi:hypothetical protein
MVEIPHRPSRSAPMMTTKPATIYIDIETIPSQEMWAHDYIKDTIKPPAQMKKPETIAKWEAEEKQNAILEAMDKLALDGAMNHIVCIGVAINDNPAITFIAENHTSEIRMLKEFYDYVGLNCGKWGINNKWVGHNISGFDLKIIRQRSMILGVKPTIDIPFMAKPWDLNPFDTMVQWDAKNFVKLDKIAKAFGIKGKSMDGSQVYDMWKNGLYEMLSDYCIDDVEMTRKVYKRMNYEAA